MNKLIFLSLLVALFFSCKSTNKITDKPNSYFKVEVIQDGKVVAKEGYVVSLQKKPFQFRLSYYKVDNVYVASSWDRDYFDYSDAKNIFWCDNNDYENCLFFAAKTGTEDKFNVNKDLYVGDRDYCMNWFYDEELDWYRMDKGVEVKKGVIHATVTVETIYDMDKRDARTFSREEYEYPVSQIDQDIYMVFAADRYEKGMDYPEELQREKFVLRFK